MREWWREASNQEKIERWEQAIRVLENMDEHTRTKHWHMAKWGVVTYCGTVACAAGHCGMDPWFMERGLVLHDDREWDGINPSFRATVREFFGDEGYHNIFMNGTERSVDQVINEIREYVVVLRGRLV